MEKSEALVKQEIVGVLEGMKTYQDVIVAHRTLKALYDQSRIEKDDWKMWAEKTKEKYFTSRKWHALPDSKIAFLLIPGCGCMHFIKYGWSEFKGVQYGDRRYTSVAATNIFEKQLAVDYDKIPDDYTKIAVWGDPIKRFKYFCGLKDIPEKLAISIIKNYKDENGVCLDAQLRRQSDFYNPTQVDMVVRRKDLAQYLNTIRDFENVPQKMYPKDWYYPNMSEEDLAFLREYYAPDYNILNETKVWGR